MKYEIANEIGISNYNSVDKGNLTARQNGYVGGYMTKGQWKCQTAVVWQIKVAYN